MASAALFLVRGLATNRAEQKRSSRARTQLAALATEEHPKSEEVDRVLARIPASEYRGEVRELVQKTLQRTYAQGTHRGRGSGESAEPVSDTLRKGENVREVTDEVHLSTGTSHPEAIEFGRIEVEAVTPRSKYRRRSSRREETPPN